MAYLSKAQILKAQFKTETFSWPDLGEIRIRELSALEQEDYAKLAIGPDGKPNLSLAKDLNAKLIVMACVDKNGNPVFEAGDLSAVRELPGKFAADLGEKIRELSGMGGSDPYSRDTLESLDHDDLVALSATVQDILVNGQKKESLVRNGNLLSG